jgi:LacI family transcriptional regulator
MIACSKVVINDRQAAYDATKFLIDKGCKRIAHFRGALLPQNSIDRFLGYKKALEDHGLPFDAKLVYICEKVDYDDGRAAAIQLLADGHKIDGLFAITDMAATGALTVFKENGIKVPHDIALMGFSNWFLSQAITPALSTVDQPGYKMGRKTFKLLRKEMNAKKQGIAFTPITKTLKTKIVERDSTPK